MNEFTVITDPHLNKMYRCKRCNVVLTAAEGLRLHVAGHLSTAPYPCPVCEERFNHKGTRTRHLLTQHGMAEVKKKGRPKMLQEAKKFICDECKNQFLTRSTLIKHIRTHKTIPCPECKSLFKKAELGIHRAEKHGFTIPTCSICGYKNNQQCRVNAHYRVVHLKEKNISCPDCDAMFFDMSRLRKHAVRHNPVRLYTCRFCKKQFPRLNSLKLHEKIHTGEKMKVCPICGDKFVQKANLNYHMVKHHMSLGNLPTQWETAKE